MLKQRNFAARSALLSKGGPHVKSKSVARRSARELIADELDVLLYEDLHDSLQQDERPPENEERQ